MAESMFKPGTFYDNIDAIVRQLGVRDVGVVWGLAKIRWKSPQERDEFLSALIERNYFDVISTGQGNNG